MIDYILRKTCTKCSLLKDLSEFGVDKQKKDGSSSNCKECKNKQSKLHYSNNVSYYKERNKRFYANLSDEKKKQYRETCNSKESSKEYHLVWRASNRDKCSAYSKKWASKQCPALLASKRKEYRKRSPHVFAYHAAKRRASEILATPCWLSQNEVDSIKLIYLKRDFINEVTGVIHQVDHIYPIKGKDSCGLHVPWNLQIITALENRRKSNRIPQYA